MKTRVDEATRRHQNGYNCAQAVACTYCDLVGMDEETMFRMIEAFGAGMGNMEGTCGAVSGACALAGMAASTGNLENPNSKGSSYKLSKEILKRFAERNQSVTCKDLKGVGTGKVLRACPDCIRDASEFVEQVIFADK